MALGPERSSTDASARVWAGEAASPSWQRLARLPREAADEKEAAPPPISPAAAADDDDEGCCCLLMDDGPSRPPLRVAGLMARALLRGEGPRKAAGVALLGSARLPLRLPEVLRRPLPCASMAGPVDAPVEGSSAPPHKAIPEEGCRIRRESGCCQERVTGRGTTCCQGPGGGGRGLQPRDAEKASSSPSSSAGADPEGEELPAAAAVLGGCHHGPVRLPSHLRVHQIRKPRRHQSSCHGGGRGEGQTNRGTVKGGGMRGK